MKRLLISVLTLVIAVGGFAHPIPVEKARQVAYHFLRAHMSLELESLKLGYVHQYDGLSDTACYVFVVDNSAYVIVAGNDIASPIWGYSVEDGFGEYIPTQIKEFFDDLSRELFEAISQTNQANVQVQKQWADLLQSDNEDVGMPTTLLKSIQNQKGLSKTTSNDAVSPLITTQWNQSAPYNAYCPTINEGTSTTKVGCGAVAVAQVLKYWNNPQSPQGKHSYVKDDLPLEIDFDTIEFDFSLMPDKLNNSSSDEEKKAIAKLMYYCGIALNTSYGVSGSAINYKDIVGALINYFGIGENVKIESRSNIEDSAWNEMLIAELKAGRPVIYRGGGTANHIFICDGYDGNGMFHFNMGHGGSYDGYYSLDAIQSSSGSFNFSSNQAAIVSIKPHLSNRTVVSQKWGQSRFVVNDTMEVYKFKTLLSRNGSQYTDTYFDGSRNVMTFVPADSSKQLKIERLEFPCQYVNIYDGEQLDSLLLKQQFSSQNSSDFPLYSTRNAISITDSANMLNYDYAFRITTTCGKVASIKSTIVLDTVFLNWGESGTSGSWQVEYGFTGFDHGQGNVIVVDTPSCVVAGLVGNRQYDFYVRPICDEFAYGDWTRARVIVPPVGLLPWKDIVTSQPNGYKVGDDGNIYISSSEGLAWLISICNSYNNAPQYYSSLYGKTVFLAQNVDMSGGIWEPLSRTPKVLDGKNHKIIGITIYDTIKGYSTNNSGFCDHLSDGDTIRNAVFESMSIVSNTSSVGGIAASVSAGGAVINCGVSGNVVSNYEYVKVGGIAGGMFGGGILNCYSGMGIYASGGTCGGVVGSVYSYSGDETRISNCYSFSSYYLDTLSYTPPSVGAVIGKASNGANIDCLAYWYQSNSSIWAGDSNVLGIIPFHKDEDKCWIDNTDSEVEGATQRLELILNNWVDKSDNASHYLRWVADSANANQGFPVFEFPQHKVSLQTSDSQMGSVVGAGNYLEDSNVIIKAIAHSCYWFVAWSDGNTDSIRSICVVQDTSYTAIFSKVPNAIGDVEESACDSYLWKGSVFYSGGDYFFDTLTSNGCDSTIHLSLEVYHSDFSGRDSVRGCDSVVWNGNVYYDDVQVPYYTTTTHGCDSLVILELVISHPIGSFHAVENCDSLVWNGKVYKEGGLYSETGVDEFGCMYFDTLLLSLKHSVSETIGLKIYSSVLPYEYNGISINEGGVYIVKLTKPDGCDSVVTLVVTVVEDKEAIENSELVSKPFLSPNPTCGYVNIAGDGVKYVEVVDAVGRIVARFAENEIIDIAALKDGVYVFRIYMECGLFLNKVIKTTNK